MKSFGEPLRCEATEALVTRLLCALLVLRAVPLQVPYTSQPHPTGLARLVNLTFLSSPAVMTLLLALLACSCILYVAGRWIALPLSVMLFMTVAPRTLIHSQGAIGHGNHIVALIVLAQLAGNLWQQRLSRSGRLHRLHPGIGPHDLAFHFARQAIAAVYIVAGLTKLLRSHGAWLMDVPNLAVHVVKTNDMYAYSHLGGATLGAMDAWASFIVAHPQASRLFFGAGLGLELGAFFALAGRRAAGAVGTGLLLMHWTTNWLMHLTFLNNQLALLIFFVGVPRLVTRGWKRFRSTWSEMPGAMAA